MSEAAINRKNKVAMAPALLANKSEVKSKTSKFKLNAKQTDLSSNEVKISTDYTELRTQLRNEDLFVSALLSNIPSQTLSHESENGSEKGNDGTANPVSSLTSRASNPEELKQRLAAKLSQFKGKKLDFADRKMKNKLKRKLDKLEKKKLKRKNNKMKSKIAKLAQTTKAAAATNSASTEVSDKQTASREATVQASSRLPKPIFNNEGRMVFSKFDFGEVTASTNHKTNLDPKAALIRAKKIKEKVQHLEDTGNKEKAREILEKQAWEGALQRAEGIKVKDDVELLSKSIKKREKMKTKSKKKWDERIESQEKQKDDRQKKRMKNIKQRKNNIKDKKLNKLAKKGKIVLT